MGRGAGVSGMGKYLAVVRQMIDKLENTQSPAIRKVAARAAESIAQGGVLHVFGSGHSHMIAEDAFNRAGGLACVNAMLEPSLMEINVGRTTMLERLPGYADILLSTYDLRPGDVIVVVSNSGINAVPIEVALTCKQRGLFVVALTSVNHSQHMASRHTSGQRLMEIADEVLDNGGVYGDAAIELDGLPQKTGATSTIMGVTIIQLLTVAVMEELLRRGIEPPVLISANGTGGEEHNRRVTECYKHRVKYL